jgi:hypothetical protein
VPPVANICRTLVEVGLGYIQLGQSSTTLSARRGARQARSRARAPFHRPDALPARRTDDGLHFDDIHKLLGVLQSLTEKGNTVVVIEHNLEVIPHGRPRHRPRPRGRCGRRKIVAEGTPEDVAEVKASHRDSSCGGCSARPRRGRGRETSGAAAAAALARGDRAREGAPADGAAAASPKVAKAPLDFSGVWEIDATESKGVSKNMEKAVISIRQSGDRIWIEPIEQKRQWLVADEIVADGRSTRRPSAAAKKARPGAVGQGQEVALDPDDGRHRGIPTRAGRAPSGS